MKNDEGTGSSKPRHEADFELQPGEKWLPQDQLLSDEEMKRRLPWLFRDEPLKKRGNIFQWPDDEEGEDE